MKRTAKFLAAVHVAKAAQIKRAEYLENDVLYSKLEAAGYFWQDGEWSNVRRSTSMFEGDDSTPTGIVRLRVMAHPADVDRAVTAVRSSLADHHAQVVEVSEQYPNRKGAGVRVYLTVHMSKG
jgi:hypothetical protein